MHFGGTQPPLSPTNVIFAQKSGADAIEKVVAQAFLDALKAAAILLQKDRSLAGPSTQLSVLIAEHLELVWTGIDFQYLVEIS